MLISSVNGKPKNSHYCQNYIYRNSSYLDAGTQVDAPFRDVFQFIDNQLRLYCLEFQI